MSASLDALEHVRQRADSIYLLMFEGWSQELRSNRWHYASRWARQLPVVLVQPERPTRREWQATAEARIPNVEILSIVGVTWPGEYLRRSLAQASQIMAHMEARGYERPLLWLYNPWLTGAYAALPAGARVFHATENYFDFESIEPYFLSLKGLALEASDLIVAVSGGVASSLAPYAAAERIVVISNGCDSAEYTIEGTKDEELLRDGAGFERTAIYAGNVNGRLDFALLKRVAIEQPRSLFAIFGPVAGLNKDDAAAWRQLLELPNVRSYGAVPSERLATLYRAADVGIIPDKRTASLVRNGFPLKALEMCATGLPTISTYMEPLLELADALVVARDDGAFARALEVADRATMSDAQRAQLAAVCAANDYDRKFEEVIRLVASLLDSGTPRTRIDELVAHFGARAWLELCRPHERTYAAMRAAVYARIYSAVGRFLPGFVRRAIPASLRDNLRRRFAARS